MIAASFDSKSILEGIRGWVEIETPTEAPAQVNRLADLVADGYRIGTLDLRIAATAISRNATLVSRNLKDFRRIKDLRVEDWAAP